VAEPFSYTENPADGYKLNFMEAELGELALSTQNRQSHDFSPVQKVQSRFKIKQLLWVGLQNFSLLGSQ